MITHTLIKKFIIILYSLFYLLPHWATLSFLGNYIVILVWHSQNIDLSTIYSYLEIYLRYPYKSSIPNHNNGREKWRKGCLKRGKGEGRWGDRKEGKDGGGRNRGRRERKGVKDGGLEFFLYHSPYHLTISYLLPSSFGLSVARLHV